MINNCLQWLGTLCLISMYIVMSFYPEAYPLNILMGLGGGLLYFGWSFRTQNKPQMIVNAAGVLVCLMGLYRAWA